jgi:uncharacterized protein YuzE
MIKEKRGTYMSEKVNRDFWIDFEQEGTVIEIEHPTTIES